LKNEEAIRECRWKTPVEWDDVDIHVFSENDLNDLLALMATMPREKGTHAVTRKIKVFRQLNKDVQGVKISQLEPLVTAIRLIMLKNTTKHWLFSETEDGYMVPWYVHYVEYTPPNPETEDGYMVPWYVHYVEYTPPNPERGTPAKTEVHLLASRLGTQIASVLNFSTSELGATAEELLRQRGYLLESPELLQVYEEENHYYQQHATRLGEQYWADGSSLDLSGSDVMPMKVDGVPARVVMDNSDEEHSSYRDTSEKSVSAAFWLDEDESEEAQEASVVELPVQAYVRVFDLRRHEYRIIHVKNLTPYDYDDALVDKLILPERRKYLLKVLVSETGSQLEDIVRGKTGGTLVISTGEAGTGKTLTAEIFSEQMRRPLYCVQCSQLGIDVDSLEKELNLVLTRARRWRAIILIDEADVYVHERGEDLVQNAIVGVFLRTLEYYNGVIFMTSNRDTVIDDAIMSRSSVWMPYSIPSIDDAASIWRVLSAQYGVKLTPADITQLTIYSAFKGISGRSIKNLLRLACRVAAYEKTAVTVEMLKMAGEHVALETGDRATRKKS